MFDWKTSRTVGFIFDFPVIVVSVLFAREGKTGLKRGGTGLKGQRLILVFPHPLKKP